MNGMMDDDCDVFNCYVELNLSSVLNKLLDLKRKGEEKKAIGYLIDELSKHQVEISKVLSRDFPEISKQMPKFLQKRIEDRRKACRFQKILGFSSMSDIENKAVRLALEDTKAMINETSMINNASIRGLVDDHREILKQLVRTIVELVTESQEEININLDVLKRFLEG